MKNIHVLPTDKSSRLYLFEERLILGDLVTVVFKNSGAVNQHIYITSDEEIKEGDWYLTNKNTLCKCIRTDNKYVYSLEGGSSTNCKKIILTTDQDLIKDGVQDIDDEFLEWFVKNPSCEWVEIQKGFEDGTSYGYNFLDYKIIIPKEEPKQEMRKVCKCKRAYENPLSEICSLCWNELYPNEKDEIKDEDLLEPKQETLTNDTDSHSWGFENFEVIKTEEDAKIFVETMENTPEPNDKLKKAFRDFNKQETLEEFAETFLPHSEIEHDTDFIIGFIAGAKWQQEQILDFLYSEITERRDYSASKMCEKVIEFIEQFKNK